MTKISKELKSKTIKELNEEVVRSREEIAKMALSQKSNPPKDTNLMQKKKKRLAVVLTVLGEKKELEKISANADQPRAEKKNK
jgi:ribosomal protein L29